MTARGADELAGEECARATCTGADEFRALYESEVAYVWSAARKLGVPERDRADIVHDVFLVVHRRLGEVDVARPIRPWIFGVTYRVIADYRRRAHVKREVLDRVADAGGGAVEATPGADEQLMLAERRAMVIRALDALDLDRRAVLVMHDIDGFPIPEVASCLDIPVNTAYSRLRVGREEFESALRRQLLRGERVHALAFGWLALADDGPLQHETREAIFARLTRSVGGALGAAAAGAGAAGGSGLLQSAPAKMILAFAMGTGLGAGADRLAVSVHAPAPAGVPAVATAMAPTPAMTSTAPPAAAAPRDPPSASTPTAPVRASLPASTGAVRSSAVPAPDRDASLAAERKQVEVARGALARGQGDAALAALDRHAAQFPNGELAEEREALAVQALALAQRTAEARTRAARFRARYPRSIFTGVVDQATAEVPERDAGHGP